MKVPGTYPAPLAANGPNGQLGAASCDTDEERKANGMSGSRWCQVAANETTEPTSPAPLAAHGPNRQLGAVACMRHMMGGNPLDLGGLADNVTALTRVLRSLYHHFTITLPSLKQASVSSVSRRHTTPSLMSVSHQHTTPSLTLRSILLQQSGNCHTPTPVRLCKLCCNGRGFFSVEGTIHDPLNLLKRGSVGRLGKAFTKHLQ